MKKRLIAICLATILLCVQLPLVGFAANVEGLNNDLLRGKTISIIGDSISTYTGWSDSQPITSEDCTHRYGEAYYGPVDSDCHNTDLLVEDTWWYQAANQLGAEILVSNAGNSTGLLYASYPNDSDWEQYLKDMLVYKSRPYFLGKDGVSPDIIAIYIGSNDVGKGTIEEFGTIDQVDFDTLIVQSDDGSFTYGEPKTVAEAYCIMLHKISITYPNAELYCFTVVPNSGGYLSTCNKRLVNTLPFNEMIKGVAEYYDAIVVDIFEEFALDPDGDGVAVQEDLDTFKTYFNGDPHPNAEGFDVISNCFVDAIIENSKYIVQIETTAGTIEHIGVSSSSHNGLTTREVNDYITKNGMLVNYQSKESSTGDSKSKFEDKYTSLNQDKTYRAEGDRECSTTTTVVTSKIDIPLQNEMKNTVSGQTVGILEQMGDVENADNDGTYDYNVIRIDEQGEIQIYTQTVSTVSTETSHEGMQYVESNTTATDDNDMMTGYPALELPSTEDEIPAISSGYEYAYLGSDKLSDFWAAYVYTSPDSDNYPDETPVYQDNNNVFYVRHTMTYEQFKKRNLVVPNLFLKNETITLDTPVQAKYESIQQFTFVTADGQIFTAYCADQLTPAVDGFSYRLVNIDDATYYSTEAAKKIQTIAYNGYWGSASGYGSLDLFKQRLANTGDFSEEELAGITDGIAMTAMQYAIWSNSNEMDDITFVNAYDTVWTGKNFKFSVADQSDVALIFKVYRYLTNLETSSEENKTTQDTLINENNFLNGITLELSEKPNNHINNQDSDESNDVYKANLAFELKVQPAEQNGDNLVIKILEGDKEVAVGRIAGEAKPGEVLLKADENGRYVFSDIYLEEGSQNIRFVLYGTQNLQQAAYLLSSENVYGESSQTMVCVAYGERNVNVEMNICFDLSVKDEVISTERVWRTEAQFGHIKGLKVDENGKPVSKGVFGLFKSDETTFTADTAFMTATTDENGEFSFKNIVCGNWLVKELSCPEHLLLSNENMEFSITGQGQVVEIKVVNELIYGSMKGLKIDEHNTPIEGVVFGLFAPDTTDFTTENTIATATTDTDGVFAFDNIPYGNWLVKELSCPNSFVLSHEIIEINITEDGQVVPYTITNKYISGKVRVYKISSANYEEKLSGASFSLYVDTNQNGAFDENIDSFYGILTESENGIYELDDLIYGGYFLIETKAPSGFLKDDGCYYFDISVDGDIITIENEAGVGFTNTPEPELEPELEEELEPELEQPTSPNTGDNSNLLVWSMLMAFGGMVFYSVFLTGKIKELRS